MNSLEAKILEEVGVGVKHAKIARDLSKEVDRLKAQDLQHDQKLARVKACFEALQQALTP